MITITRVQTKVGKERPENKACLERADAAHRHGFSKVDDAAGCAKRLKSLIDETWRREGPGGSTGLQNACAGFSRVM
jgi:hypothetical protein